MSFSARFPRSGAGREQLRWRCAPYLEGSEVKVAQLCPTLCDPVEYSPWNSPSQNTGVGSLSLVQGIFSTQVSHIAGRFFTSWAIREATFLAGLLRNRPESQSSPAEPKQEGRGKSTTFKRKTWLEDMT